MRRPSPRTRSARARSRYACHTGLIWVRRPRTRAIARGRWRSSGACSGQGARSPAELAILLTALGEREQAFASLEDAYRARDIQLQYLGVEPGFDPLRSTLASRTWCDGSASRGEHSSATSLLGLTLTLTRAA